MNQELIAYISELYSIPNLSAKSGEVTTGTLSVSSILWDGNKRYFLKQYRDSFTEERVKEVHQAKRFFSDGGIPVILPMQTKMGTTYFAFGGFLYALFPFINGVHLDRNDMSRKAIENMAAMLGKIHTLGKKPGFKISASFKPWDKAKFLDKAHKILEKINAKSTKDDFDKLAIVNVETKIALVNGTDKKLSDYKLGEPHLIHGDYHDHNLFFNEQEEVTHVFDFEKADMSPRTYELIRSMNFTCLDGEVTEDRIQNAAAYLKAYNAVYPISKEEFVAGMQVYYMKTIHSLWVVEEYYLNNNFRPSIFLKKTVDTLMYFKDHYNDLTEKLSQVLG